MGRTLTGALVLGLAVGALAGCEPNDGGTPQASGATSAPQPQGRPTDCGWNVYDKACDTPQAAAPVPSADAYNLEPSATDDTALVHGARAWGGDVMGDCSIYLWPAGTGIEVIPHYYPASSGHPYPYSAVAVDLTTGCVGFQPRSHVITIGLQRYYGLALPGHAPQAPAWHDVTTPLVDGTIPNVVPLSPGTGLMPYGLMTHYNLPHSYLPAVAVPCLPTGLLSTYRATFEVTGTSYGGRPFAGGGTGSAFTVTPDMCTHIS